MTKPRAPRAPRAALQKDGDTCPRAVLTTAPGTIGPYGYIAGLIIEGVPADVAQVNAAWMNARPDDVAAARAAGADSVPYRG